MIPKYLLARLAALALLIPNGAAYAASPPFPDKPIDVVGRGQPIDAFLKDLFGQAGLASNISSSVSGSIQGRFTGKPARIWEQVAKAFDLVAYFDGNTVRVYAAKDMQSRTIAAAAPSEVAAEVRRLGLTDSHNTLRTGASIVTASGTPFFIQNVEKIAASILPKVAKSSPVSPILPPVTAGGADIVSPLAKGPLSPAQASPWAGRMTVRSRATSRSPYEVRIFYLRYARADDTITEADGRTTRVPGVASIIRGMMGDGRISGTVSSSGNVLVARQSQPRLGGRGLGAIPPGASQRDYDDGDFVVLDTERVEAPGPARDVNGPRVEVDPANNAVLVRDRPESMPVYEDLIASLDIEPIGLEVEATIINLDTNRLRDLGFDFNLNIGGLNAVFGGVAVAPTTSFSDPGLGASYLTGSGDEFVARLTALEKNGTATVTSRPRLSMLNNDTAVFDNQTEYFVRVAGDRQVDLFPIKVGMVMRITSSIVYDGGELRTRLGIEIQDGSISGPIVDGIPGIKRSSITTNAIIKQGESLLIGGITVENEFDFKSKVPGLGDIPLVGNAFKKRSKGGGRIERLFLITPRVLTRQKAPTMAAAPVPAIPIEQLERGLKRVRGQRGTEVQR